MFKRYMEQHSGSAIVLGSAPCVRTDFDQASELLPDASIFAVNEATRIAKPDFLCSFHYEKMDFFNRYAVDFWGAVGWSTHAAVVTERGCHPDKVPAVDYWWPELWKPARTSAWFAAEIARLMGFERILLCGCPMNGGDGYYNDTAKSSERFGVIKPNGSYVVSVRDSIRLVAEEGLMPEVRSMSGYTRELFGGPIWASHSSAS